MPQIFLCDFFVRENWPNFADVVVTGMSTSGNESNVRTYFSENEFSYKKQDVWYQKIVTIEKIKKCENSIIGRSRVLFFIRIHTYNLTTHLSTFDNHSP